MARQPARAVRVPTFHSPRTSPITALAVLEPQTDDDMVATYELLCDEYSQACGDAFLNVCESLAQQRGLIGANGRLTARGRMMAAPVRTEAKRTAPRRTGKLARSITGRPVIVGRKRAR